MLSEVTDTNGDGALDTMTASTATASMLTSVEAPALPRANSYSVVTADSNTTKSTNTSETTSTTATSTTSLSTGRSVSASGNGASTANNLADSAGSASAILSAASPVLTTTPSLATNEDDLTVLTLSEDRYGFPLNTEEAKRYLKYAPQYETRDAKMERKWDAMCKKYKWDITGFPPRSELMPYNQFRALVLKGVPRKYRADLWKKLSGACELQLNEEPGYYAQLISNSSSVIQTTVREEIERDLGRTFPHHTLFSQVDSSIVQSMRRILYAYSTRNRSVGYCQGMNMLTGWMLLFLPEEDTFWILCAIVEYICPLYYTQNMMGCQIDLRVFGDLVKQNHPKEFEHLESLCISLPLVTTRWFLCAFITVVPSETCLRIWDAFLLHGTMILFRAGVALIRLCSKKFMSADSTLQVVKFFQDFPATVFNHSKLFKLIEAMSHITYKRVEFMHAKYEDELKRETEEIHRARDVQHLARFTSFTREELERFWDQVSKLNNVDRNTRGSVVFNFEQFQGILSSIVPGWQPNTPAMLQLFKIFDENGDNRLDFRELMTGLSLLSKGSLEDKLMLCFRTYDPENKGYISKSAVVDMLFSVYKNSSPALVAKDPEKIMCALKDLVDKLCVHLGIHGDIPLSFEDFRQFVNCQPQLIEHFVVTDHCEAEMDPPSTHTSKKKTNPKYQQYDLDTLLYTSVGHARGAVIKDSLLGQDGKPAKSKSKRASIGSKFVLMPSTENHASTSSAEAGSSSYLHRAASTGNVGTSSIPIGKSRAERQEVGVVVGSVGSVCDEEMQVADLGPPSSTYPPLTSVAVDHQNTESSTEPIYETLSEAVTEPHHYSALSVQQDELLDPLLSAPKGAMERAAKSHRCPWCLCTCL
ncbi:TBC1 domain family member 2B [Pelomyxa schiedti]|nr:TBC1 domain family member 2B [Pelomyxa schiedti]